LSKTEIKSFWDAFDDAGLVRSSALKTILITGQRPGEVRHIKDGWWEMPGEPNAKLGWQSHRVWLSKEVRTVLSELDDEDV
jgi:integrase